ncbi:MAG TPA: hypothetical protein VKX28_33860 [Xanthobacteraceae bacterium]|nr:hypothetical protein [Xanthobacteraceae bacterium]
MTRATKTFFGAAIGAAAVAFFATSAVADVACSGDVCWHVKERYKYPAESHVVIHEDSWKPGPSIKFHEHEGRGYWRGETWVDIK